MANITQALMFVLLLNALMWLSQIAILELNPAQSSFFNPEGTILTDYAVDGDLDSPQLDTSSINEHFPSNAGTVENEQGNIFTDAFKSIKNWFSGLPGVNYALATVSMPYTVLKIMRLPIPFVYIIGTLWYVLTLFLIIAFFWGKEV